MSDDKVTWLPNLVGGVSIWKLAVDLNEPKFFDGRLLVPETEGSDSLPVRVRWDVSSMLPLREARATMPAETDAALREFSACLARVAEAFAAPQSGYQKFKDAFTVPSLEADGGANYFYAPRTKKVCVVNWGASPRNITGHGELFFGLEGFGKLLDKADLDAPPPVGAALAAGAAATGALAAAGAAESKSQDEAKKDAKKDEPRGALWWGKPWWVWLLVLLAIVALLLLLAWAIRGCDDPKAAADGADAGLDASADAALLDATADAGDADSGADASADAGDADSGADASADAGDADSGADASADAGDAGPDAGPDGGNEGGKDSGSESGKDGGSEGGKDGGEVSDASGPGAGSAAGSGPVVLLPGGSFQGGDGLPHREHFHPDAVRWRLVAGREMLAPGSPAAWDGDTFHVFLNRGQTFQGLKVEWQDRAGKWHSH